MHTRFSIYSVVRNAAAVTLLALGVGCSSDGANSDLVPSSSLSTLAVDSSSVLADGTALSTITVTVLNAGGKPVVGAAVAVDSTGTANVLTQPVALTDENGTTTATIASTRAQVKTLSASTSLLGLTVNLNATSQVTFVPGSANQSVSTLEATSGQLIADGNDKTTVAATIRDAQGNRIEGAAVTFAATGLENSFPMGTSALTDVLGVATVEMATTRAQVKTLTAMVGSGASAVSLDAEAMVTFAPIPDILESEPNDTPTTALELPIGTVGTGSVTTTVALGGGGVTDVDFWSFDLGAEEVVQIEFFATRLDQDSWADAPRRITLWDAEGTTKLVEHEADYGSRGDLDIPRFYSATESTYLLTVTQDDASLPGGNYALVITPLELPTLQTEAAGTLTAGVLLGEYELGSTDTFTISVSEPTLIDLTVFGWRLGTAFGANPSSFLFDPQVVVRDSTGSIYSDYSFFNDPNVQVYLAAAGDYTVEVEDCCGGREGGIQLATYFVDLEVTAANAIDEVEPNNDAMEAQVLPFDSLVTGTVFGKVDGDVFAINAAAGDELWLEMFGRELTLPRPGGGGDGGGQEVRPILLDPDLNEIRTSFANYYDGGARYTALIRESGPYFVLVISDSGQPEYYSLRVRRVGQHPFEFEPNDTNENATPLARGASAAGTLDQSKEGQDVDVFAVAAASAGDLVIVDLQAADPQRSYQGVYDLGSRLYANLSVRDAEGEVIAESDVFQTPAKGLVHGGLSNEVAFIAPAAATYYVTVESDNRRDGLGIGSSNHYVIHRRR